jgi:hypothetical protein
VGTAAAAAAAATAAAITMVCVGNGKLQKERESRHADRGDKEQNNDAPLEPEPPFVNEKPKDQRCKATH